MNSHSNTPVLHFVPCINSFIKVKLFHLWTFYMNLPIIGQSTQSVPKHCWFWAACGRHGAAPCGQHGAAADAADTALSYGGREGHSRPPPVRRATGACRTGGGWECPSRPPYFREELTSSRYSAADTRPIQRCREQPMRGRYSAAANSRHTANWQHSTADTRPIQCSCEQPTRGRHSTCKSQRGAEPIQPGAPPR